MSRIGREPITIPAGVEVTVGAENQITVKGPLGTLCEKMPGSMTITRDGDVLTVARPNDEKEMKSLHGLTRALLFNMVQGVTLEVPDANTVIVKSPSKQKCGEIAAQIRKKRPPEPYLGKGVKYDTEHIRRKAGKAGK